MFELANLMLSGCQTQLSVAAGRGQAEVGSTLSVCRVFDGYRTLKRDLEAAGLLTAEPDDESSAAR